MIFSVVLVAGLLVAGSGLTEGIGYCGDHGGSPFDYKELLCQAIIFYEANRSGRLSNMRIDWRGDSALNDGADVGVDLSGGYYDAGDLVKFGFPLGFTVTFLSWGMLSYGDGYTASGQTDYALDAIRWATDFILKAKTSPTTLWGQVGDGDLDHSLWGRPEDMTMNRPSAKIDANAPGSELAAETAAGLAAASLVFKNTDSSYASTLLSAARDLFDFANNYRETYTNSIPGADDFYHSYSGYGDELCWAAIWLYKATGEQTYLTTAESLWSEFSIQYGASFSWENKKSGTIAMFAEVVGGQYVGILQSHVAELRAIQTTPGGLSYFQHWGSLRYALNHAFIAFRAIDLGLDVATNTAWAEKQVRYVLGENPRSSSYVVGTGNNPPTHCHHRAASCGNIGTPCGWDQGNSASDNGHILWGAMVGGPDENDGYTDERQNWEQNEVGCDYNAALASTLARMVSQGLKEEALAQKVAQEE